MEWFKIKEKKPKAGELCLTYSYVGVHKESFFHLAYWDAEENAFYSNWLGQYYMPQYWTGLEKPKIRRGNKNTENNIVKKSET